MSALLEAGCEHVSMSVYADVVAVSAASVAHVLDRAKTCIAARGRFVVAVSGGSIPPILRQISAGIASEGTVERWRFVFADERCVSIDHPDSNFGIWKREIFDNIAGFDLVRNVLHIERWENSQECAGDYQSRLGTFLGMPGDMGASPGALIDLVVLGMGPDGHTASLFPDHALVARSSEAETMIVSIDESPKPPPRRITFSLAALNDAVEVLFIVTGASKAAAIGSIFAASDIHCVDGVSCCELHVTESNHYPASLIRTERSGMPVRWVLDAAAASTLVALSQNTRVMKSD